MIRASIIYYKRGIDSMSLIDNPNEKAKLKSTRLLVAISFLILIMLNVTSLVQANENIFKRAKIAMDDSDYEQAATLFKRLASNNEFKTQALFGLAKVAFYQEQLDIADGHIAKVLAISPDNPEYLFIAARIAGKQAQSASIFSKLGYARDAKRYFLHALEIDKNHQPSLIGLIKFHQQAPILAGGDKDEIPTVLNRLRAIDKREAFSIEAPMLLNKGKVTKVLTLYNDALQAKPISDVANARFRFNFAMLMSSQGVYEHALEALISIDIKSDLEIADLLTMRLYQMGKMAAESNSQLELGLKSMTKYAKIPQKDKTISKNWVDFRMAQLRFLNNDQSINEQTLNKMIQTTSDNALKSKIKAFLKENKIQRKS